MDGIFCIIFADIVRFSLSFCSDATINCQASPHAGRDVQHRVAQYSAVVQAQYF